MILEIAGYIGCSPSEVLAMSSSDITLLAGYNRVEPFSVRRDDYHHARTQAVITNGINNILYAFGRLKSRKTAQPSDFVFQRKQTKEQKARTFAAALSQMSKKQKPKI